MFFSGHILGNFEIKILSIFEMYIGNSTYVKVTQDKKHLFYFQEILKFSSVKTRLVIKILVYFYR